MPKKGKQKKQYARARGHTPIAADEHHSRDLSHPYRGVDSLRRMTIDGVRGVPVGRAIWLPSWETFDHFDNPAKRAELEKRLAQKEAGASSAGRQPDQDAIPSHRRSRNTNARKIRDQRIKWALTTTIRIGPQPRLIVAGVNRYKDLFSRSITQKIFDLLDICEGNPPLFPSREVRPTEPLSKFALNIEACITFAPDTEDVGTPMDHCGPMLGVELEQGRELWFAPLNHRPIELQPLQNQHVLLRVIAGLMYLAVLSRQQTVSLYPPRVQNRALNLGLKMLSFFCGVSDSRWSDTTLLVNSASGWQAQFNLHALILSRSPFFARCIPDSRHLIIEIFVHDPVINQDAIHICPAHIYGAAPPQQQPLPASTARALLAAASLLELDDLAELALAQARSSLVLDAELIPTTHFLSSSVGCGCSGGIDIPKRGGGGRE
ncbi:unnamed protein product [Tilletia controversa]|nr:unnamed protein product [Tilletia controversa]